MPKLEAIGDDIWIVDGDNVSFYGFAYPTRSVVVRLATGDVWFWSPIAHDAELAAEIDAIGPIKYLISPNMIHHLFLGEWHERYPDARLFGPKQTIAKRKDLAFAGALPGEAPDEWCGEIEVIAVEGSFFMSEIDFFHVRSRTLILADLSENFSPAFLEAFWAPWQRAIARVWGIVEGKGYAPLEWRASFLDRRSLRAAKARFLEFDPQNVVMAHGTPVRENGRAYVEQAFAWVRG